jgi:hypothetical protein
MYNSLIIKLDPVKINKEKRKKIQIPMIMDEMDDHINKLSTQSRAHSSRA